MENSNTNSAVTLRPVEEVTVFEVGDRVRDAMYGMGVIESLGGAMLSNWVRLKSNASTPT